MIDNKTHDGKARGKAKAAKSKFATREQWLEAAIDLFRPDFITRGKPLPEKIRVSIGFALGSRKFVGQCWSANASDDGIQQIFVSPVLGQVSDGHDSILATLLHECCHAALPNGAGHKHPFQVLAGSVGFTAPWKSTPASPELLKRLNALGKTLGPIPHGKLSPDQLIKKKQSTRMIKFTCEECGYVVRTTAKWINYAGAPRCAVKAHGQMFADLPDDEDDGEGEE